MEIVPYSEIENKAIDKQLFSIFIESAGYQDLSEKRKEYMYQYLVKEYYQRHPELFYVAKIDDKVAGYLCFCPDTLKALTLWIPFGYYNVFKDFYKHIPGHLHINISSQYRGQKIGSQLLAKAKKEIDFAFSAINTEKATNTSFYQKNSFTMQSKRDFKGQALVLWSSC